MEEKNSQHGRSARAVHCGKAPVRRVSRSRLRLAAERVRAPAPVSLGGGGIGTRSSVKTPPRRWRGETPRFPGRGVRVCTPDRGTCGAAEGRERARTDDGVVHGRRAREPSAGIRISKGHFNESIYDLHAAAYAHQQR